MAIRCGKQAASGIFHERAQETISHVRRAGEMRDVHHTELLIQLKNIVNNLVFGLAAISMTSKKDIRKLLSKQSVTFGQFKLEFGPLTEVLNIEQNMHITHKQFMLFLARATLTDACIVIRDYAKRNENAAKILSELSYVQLEAIVSLIQSNESIEIAPPELWAMHFELVQCVERHIQTHES